MAAISMQALLIHDIIVKNTIRLIHVPTVDGLHLMRDLRTKEQNAMIVAHASKSILTKLE